MPFAVASTLDRIRCMNNTSYRAATNLRPIVSRCCRREAVGRASSGRLKRPGAGPGGRRRRPVVSIRSAKDATRMDFRKDPLRLSRRALGAGVVLTAIGAPDPATAAEAAAKPDESAVHTFAMTIEDTILTLVDKQTFHTFSFNGQTPGPLIHVREGDRVEISVENQTTLPHTIHWHGLLQKNNWMLDGVPDVTQMAIAPGDTFTYRYVAEPSGTMWYHCHVNVNEHVAMRGM